MTMDREHLTELLTRLRVLADERAASVETRCAELTHHAEGTGATSEASVAAALYHERECRQWNDLVGEIDEAMAELRQVDQVARPIEQRALCTEEERR
jgi:hypothetical protein